MTRLQKQPGKVEIQDDVVFGTGGERDLKCDVFLPPNDDKKRMGILLIHGGGWMQGDKSQLRGYGIQLARYGFVAVCSEYRLSTEAPWPAQIHDCKAALRWMRANAASLGLDPDRIAVSGNSAGAHLSLMVGATPNETDFEGSGGHGGTDTSVSAVIAIYPPTRLKTRGNLESAVDLLFGDPEIAEEVQTRASPISWSHGDFPPTMLVHGNNDQVVPVSETFNMYEQLTQKGAKVEMHIYEGAPHAFDREPEFFNQVADMIALFTDRQLGRARFEA